MTETERLNNTVTKFQLLANSLAFVTMDKAAGLESDALAHQVKTAMRDLIRTEVLYKEVRYESVTTSQS